MSEEMKEVEVPLGEKVVLLRPKENYPPSRDSVQKMLRYINECFQEVKGTNKPLIVFIPHAIDVIVVDVEGNVEVY